MNNFRYKLATFFQGRCGVDNLGRATAVFALVMMALTMIFHLNVFYLLAMAALVYSYWRMMSKNIAKRYQENQKFLMYTSGIRTVWRKAVYNVKRFFSKTSYDMDQRKTYAIFKCPNCKQKLRAPKGRGKIEVTCRNCKTTFIRKV